ncbi:YciI family protein [Klenkia sp. PcliD-1-E]|uniref:YciI family protein n=1 Tax=Klenkia sp. PcliD-1-E TaxID=2954492 RepID=UPI002096FFCF|nr:YciI family protein [Klenkia sp. PcliD-1-E]MCO7220890.1 YciI family protein [Klenkia sp. PcliD-1-E]
MIVAVTYRYTEDTALRDEVRPEHREFLRGLADAGSLLLSGPFGAGAPAGALLVFRAEDEAQVQGWLDADPFAVRGVVAGTTVAEWDPVLGSLTGAL